MKPNVKELVRMLAAQGGWAQRSKVAVLRRRLPCTPARSRRALQSKQLELPFTKAVEEGKQRREYSVLVTSLEWEAPHWRGCSGIERMRGMRSKS